MVKWKSAQDTKSAHITNFGATISMIATPEPNYLYQI